jgi:hypothetical protein
MNKKKAAVGETQSPFMTGGDWSVGLNSPTSISHAELLTVLGQQLRASYDSLVLEQVPPHLAPLIDELDRKTRKRS